MLPTRGVGDGSIIGRNIRTSRSVDENVQGQNSGMQKPYGNSLPYALQYTITSITNAVSVALAAWRQFAA